MADPYAYLPGPLATEIRRLPSPLPFRYQTSHTHRNWAQIHTSRPSLYLTPHTVPELRQIIQLAHRCRATLTMTGCGHSPNDLTMTSSWLLNLDALSSILSADTESGLVTMQAGIRLYQLNAELSRRDLAMPNLGSIDQQSIAGALATSTHGSSLSHGSLSASVTSLKILLTSGDEVLCSPNERPDLFAAALTSLGALGIITELTFRAVPSFRLHWTQSVVPLSSILSEWETSLWTASEYTRVWWLPYTCRAILWRADRTSAPLRDPPASWYGAGFGRTAYQCALWVSNFLPWLLPGIERVVFGLQYGFGEETTSSAVQDSPKALLMDCLYSQFVNEWAIPLRHGPEAIWRLSAWLRRRPWEEHRIPIRILPSTYVHAPIEVRVSSCHTQEPYRGSLDFSMESEPTLYLNATLYRPFLWNPPCRERYYEAFEWVMKKYGGRPHWAKNFQSVGREELEGMYGERLEKWRKVRKEVDPQGLFAGEYHKRLVLSEDDVKALEIQ